MNAQSARLHQLPDDLLGMTYANANEWLVAEGEIELRGERRRAVDLVLGPGGPLFTVEVRQWLEGLAAHPLRLYEVQEALPGEGVWQGRGTSWSTLSPTRRRWLVYAPRASRRRPPAVSLLHVRH